MTVDGKPLLAISFDGANVYTLETPPTGKSQVAKQATGKDFQPPKNPADFLGISTGLRSGLDRKDKTLVQDVGKIKLDDGTEAYVVKSGLPGEGGPEDMKHSYALFTIRADNNLLEKMEMVINGQSMYVVRRGKSDAGKEPTVGWNLAGIAQQAAGTPACRDSESLPTWWFPTCRSSTW